MGSYGEIFRAYVITLFFDDPYGVDKKLVEHLEYIHIFQKLYLPSLVR